MADDKRPQFSAIAEDNLAIGALPIIAKPKTRVDYGRMLGVVRRLDGRNRSNIRRCKIARNGNELTVIWYVCFEGGRERYRLW